MVERKQHWLPAQISEAQECIRFGFDRITADPDILGGKACIRGMRIPVSLIVNLIANGMNASEIIMDYPDIEPEDVRQALQYAAWTAEDAVHAPLDAPA